MSILAAAGPAEKRQMAMVSEAYNHLVKKATSGEVSDDVLGKIGMLANDISVRNFASASAIQTVSSGWCYVIYTLCLHGLFLIIALVIISDVCYRIWRTQYGLNKKNGLKG